MGITRRKRGETPRSWEFFRRSCAEERSLLGFESVCIIRVGMDFIDFLLAKVACGGNGGISNLLNE